MKTTETNAAVMAAGSLRSIYRTLDRSDAEFLEAVAHELLRARKKFPSPELSMMALTEETGELAKALLTESSENVYNEAIQVATMAMRVATEGDPTVDRFRERNGLTPSATTTEH